MQLYAQFEDRSGRGGFLFDPASGLSLEKSWGFAVGYGFDINFGAYNMILKPAGTPQFVVKVGASLIFL